jgi:hypothetical protein
MHLQHFLELLKLFHFLNTLYYFNSFIIIALLTVILTVLLTVLLFLNSFKRLFAAANFSSLLKSSL